MCKNLTSEYTLAKVKMKQRMFMLFTILLVIPVILKVPWCFITLDNCPPVDTAIIILTHPSNSQNESSLNNFNIFTNAMPCPHS